MQGGSLTKTLVISLSGGVDSMVLCKILVLLAKEHNEKQYRNSKARREGSSNINVPRNKRQKLNTIAPKINVLALHVNYNNRPESAAEATYLQEWCKMHDVDIVVNAYTDIKRGVTPRDVYEKETRRRRYQFYKDVLSNQYHKGGVDLDVHASGVFFGHHQGDVQENVISNTMKGSSLLDLPGMYVLNPLHCFFYITTLTLSLSRSFTLSGIHPVRSMVLQYIAQCFP